MLEIEPDIQDLPHAIDAGEVEGWVEFRQVSFTYRDEFGYVLDNITLDIAAGEYVALVGASGVGKTTFCSLIPRFYDVTTGEIPARRHQHQRYGLWLRCDAISGLCIKMFIFLLEQCWIISAMANVMQRMKKL